MARYLVTGGAGFIGSHLCDRLLAAGHGVRVFDDLSTGKRSNLPPQVDLVLGDVADRKAVGAVCRNVDGIFHLAAIASVERSAQAWPETHRVNQAGSVAVLDAAREMGRVPVVLASSAAVYGDGGRSLLRETRPTRPLAGYGADKLGSELHAGVGWRVHGVPSAGLRLFNVFGPRQDPRSPYSGVISIFADRISAGRPITIFGDGRQTRDFISVTDVTRYLQAAMGSLQASPRHFVGNVCTGETVSIKKLAEVIARIAGRRLVIERAAPRSGDIRHSRGDPTFTNEALGLRAEVTLEEGLKTLVQDWPKS